MPCDREGSSRNEAGNFCYCQANQFPFLYNSRSLQLSTKQIKESVGRQIWLSNQ